MKDKIKNNSIDISAIRERLQNLNGKQYWRSLEEVAETEEFQHWVENEFRYSPMDWRRVQPAQISATDGRIHGSRRTQRLYASAD